MVRNQPMEPLVAPQDHAVQLALVEVAAAGIEVAQDDLILASKRLPGPDRGVGQRLDLGQGFAGLDVNPEEDDVGLALAWDIIQCYSQISQQQFLQLNL